ncbi:DUF2267 domain-containing protein [Gillisia sp. M10.2A]|uniref:DUF2267 domain-containing protein n=1 Tax=Gillisia lutea TaxID=2909668 RepID=A0ABS9EG69_9FLAO|nr:DUF2267 domain-containing protein [Gillisia lutea]MCF4101124.1 DUF2267 domain-containing protein [Gillisia lutea]
MALNFKQYSAEGNRFLKEYAKKLEIPDDRDKAGRILTAIFHGLREIITVEESLQFIAQLPMFLKAVYVNGWSTKMKKYKIKNMPQFIDLVRTLDGTTSVYDFESDENAEQYIHATFHFLRSYVSRGELEDIRDELPKRLKDMIYNHIFY